MTTKAKTNQPDFELEGAKPTRPGDIDRLALSGFLFEDDYRNQSVSFSEFCALARSAGYAGVELRDTQIGPNASEQQRREVMNAVGAEGLTVTCLTARGLPGSGSAQDDFFRRYLDLCRDLDCGLLKISSDPAWLAWACDRAKEVGVTLAVNNHVGGRLETVVGTREFFAEVGREDFGLLYDSYHLYATGQDYLGCIAEFFPRIRNVLVHSIRPAKPGEKIDLEKDGRGWVSALLDEPGVQDWPGIFQQFKRLRYREWITVIESGWPKDRREFIARRCAELISTWWRTVE